MATLVPGEKARMYALGAIMRGGASRGGYIDGRVYVSIGGNDMGFIRDDAQVGTIIDSLSITQQLDEVVDTANLRINAAVPPAGGEVVIALGSQNGRRLFAGYGLTRNQLYAADKPANIQADFSAVDYTWLLAFAKVTKQYRGMSGTAIIQDLIATYAAGNGFTTAAVQANLPALEITFTDEDVPNAITRLMRRLGGHWFVDASKDVHAWIGDDATMSPPLALTPTHPSLADVRATVDQTQALTRVYVEHQGTQLLAAVNAGETILPVESVGGITAAPDVFLKLSFSGAEGGAQHLDFTGVVPSAGGSLIGPGIAPSSAPILGPVVSATGMEAGTHSYAYTFVTAAGETKPSAAATFDTAVAGPATAPLVIQNPPQPTPPGVYGSNFTIGSSFRFAIAHCFSPTNDPAQDSPISPPSLAYTAISNNDPLNPTNSAQMRIGVVMPAPAAVKWVYVYVSTNGGPFYRWAPVQNLYPDNPPYTYEVSTSGASNPMSGPTPPATVNARQVNVSAIGIGPAGTTARKLYRTKANQAPLLLVTTLANNTATTYGPDAAADATLGAAAPVGDTSGLKAPEGTVNPGVAIVPVASTSVFRATGGWALVAEQAIRYTGLSATELTGVPASGLGAVVGPMQYNTAIRSAPLITGIPTTGPRAIGPGGLAAGHEAYAVVQVDDTAAQSTLAARLGVASGIREEWIADRRLSYTEAKARGQATLQVRPLDALSISYRCRDISTAVGKTITVNLPAPTNIVGTFRIQAVTITNFRPYAWQPPTFLVQASSTRFTFEDWLRIMKTDT